MPCFVEAAIPTLGLQQPDKPNTQIFGTYFYTYAFVVAVVTSQQLVALRKKILLKPFAYLIVIPHADTV